MTVVGKILVFLNLLISVGMAALIVANYVNRTNWKAEYEELRNKVLVSDSAYKFERTARENDKKNFQDKIAQLTADVKSKVDMVDARDKDLATVRDELRAAQLSTGDSSRNSTIAKQELDRIRQERELLANEKKSREVEIVNLRKEADAQKQSAVEKEILAKSLQGKLDKLLDSYQSQIALNKELQFKLNSGTGGAVAGNEPRTLSSQGPTAPPANVRGTVMAFAESGLTSISIGTDHGIQQGTKVAVFRLNEQNPAASKYLGELLIRTSKPKESVGQFYAATKDMPQPGDTVGSLR